MEKNIGVINVGRNKAILITFLTFNFRSRYSYLRVIAIRTYNLSHGPLNTKYKYQSQVSNI